MNFRIPNFFENERTLVRFSSGFLGHQGNVFLTSTASGLPYSKEKFEKFRTAFLIIKVIFGFNFM